MPVSKISVVGDERLEARRVAVDRPALGSLGCSRLAVDRLAEDVPDATERLVADGHGDRLAGVDDIDARARGRPSSPWRLRGRGRRRGAAAPPRRDARLLALELRDDDPEGRVDLRQAVGEHGVDDDALDLDHLADVASRSVLVRHLSPVTIRCRGRRRRAAGSAPARAPGVYRSARRAPGMFVPLCRSCSSAATRVAWSMLQQYELRSAGIMLLRLLSAMSVTSRAAGRADPAAGARGCRPSASSARCAGCGGRADPGSRACSAAPLAADVVAHAVLGRQRHHGEQRGRGHRRRGDPRPELRMTSRARRRRSGRRIGRRDRTAAASRSASVNEDVYPAANAAQSAQRSTWRRSERRSLDLGELPVEAERDGLARPVAVTRTRLRD